MHCISTLLPAYGLWRKLSDPTAGFLRLTRRSLGEEISPEVWVRRHRNFNGICGTFSWFAARQFPCGSIFGAFRADTNFLFAAQGREVHQVHKFATDEGQTGRFEYREILIEVQFESEL